MNGWVVQAGVSVDLPTHLKSIFCHTQSVLVHGMSHVCQRMWSRQPHVANSAHASEPVMLRRVLGHGSGGLVSTTLLVS